MSLTSASSWGRVSSAMASGNGGVLLVALRVGIGGLRELNRTAAAGAAPNSTGCAAITCASSALGNIVPTPGVNPVAPSVANADVASSTFNVSARFAARLPTLVSILSLLDAADLSEPVLFAETADNGPGLAIPMTTKSSAGVAESCDRFCCECTLNTGTWTALLGGRNAAGGSTKRVFAGVVAPHRLFLRPTESRLDALLRAFGLISSSDVPLVPVPSAADPASSTGTAP